MLFPIHRISACTTAFRVDYCYICVYHLWLVCVFSLDAFPDPSYFCVYHGFQGRLLLYMRVPPLVGLCFFPGVFLSSRVTGACPVTTDLIMRVNVRTTTFVMVFP